MADTVQYLMEQMIPELEELEEKGYFTRSEVKKIAQKRQGFEYLLKRRAALKEDFYRYIEFETKLEELRKSRKQAASAKGKKGLAEVAIVRRIHFIYERATRKFRSDVGLWMRWIEVCKRFRSSKQLSKVITKALQRHSTVPELWIEAARWEFDTNNNIAAARSLMQQGIRMCKTEETIWVQYYRLELLYALKLRVRRRVLGIDTITEGEGQDEERSAAAARAIMQGGVARIVFKNAIEALPARLAFRARFLDVLRAFDFDFVTGLVEQVYGSIQKDFGKAEEAWELLARRHIEFAAARAPAEQAPEEEAEAAERVLQQQQRQQPGESGQQQQQQSEEEDAAAGAWDADAHQRACSAFEEGLAAVPTAKMYHLYDQYLCDVLEARMEAGEGALQEAVGVAAQLFALLQRAHSAGCCCPETYLAWVEWAERVRQPKMALKAARKGCERFPADVSVWRRRLQLEQSLASAGQHSAKELFSSFAAALQATQPEEASELWHMAVQALPASSPEFGRLGEMLAAACCAVAKKAPSGGLGQVAAVMVEKARSSVGIEAARRLYTRLLSVPAAGGDLYRCAVRLEQEEAGAQPGTSSGGAPTSAEGRAAAAKRVCGLYEAAVSAHGSSEVDLWVGYARWLVRCGKGAGQVVWRAAKELEDADAFVAQYREELQ